MLRQPSADNDLDQLDPTDRAALHRALVSSQEDLEAGRLVDAEEVLRKLREPRPSQSPGS